MIETPFSVSVDVNGFVLGADVDALVALVPEFGVLGAIVPSRTIHLISSELGAINRLKSDF